MHFSVCLSYTNIALPSRLSYLTRVKLSFYKKSSFNFQTHLPVRRHTWEQPGEIQSWEDEDVLIMPQSYMRRGQYLKTSAPPSKPFLSAVAL